MAFPNNVYFDVLKAHFTHAFFHKAEDTLSFDGMSFICEGYRFPENFFQWFDFTIAPTDEQASAHIKKLRLELSSITERYPRLEGVNAPLEDFYSLFGFKLLTKEIIIPHFDGSASIIEYRYHWYRVQAVLGWLFTSGKIKRQFFFNARLLTSTSRIVPDMFASAPGVHLPNYQELPQSTGLISLMDETSINGYLTTRQQCIAIMNMLTVMGVDFSRLNLTTVARFMHHLLQKPIPIDKNGNEIIANSPIYKTLKAPYGVSNSKLKEDLSVVKQEYGTLDMGNHATPLKTMLNRLDFKLEEADKKR